MTDSDSGNDPWVARLSADDTRDEALVELRSILLRGLCKAFSGQGGGTAFAEDVTQETLIRSLEKLDQFAGRSKFTTWAMSIGVRIGVSQLRRKMFKDVSLSALDSEENLSFTFADESVESVETVDFRSSAIGELRRLIAENLTDRQRQATDAILHGMPVEEIAARTDSNRNAVYKLIHDARLKLKQGMEAAGFSADDIHMEFA